MKRNCGHCSWGLSGRCPNPKTTEYCSDMGHHVEQNFTLAGLELSKEHQQGMDGGFISLPNSLYNPKKWTPLFVKGLKSKHGYDSLEVIDWDNGYYLVIGKYRSDCQLKFQFSSWLCIYKAEDDIKKMLESVK